MTNNQAIAYIKGIIKRYNDNGGSSVLLCIDQEDIEALKYAAESLQTDEVYNLMHENIPFVILPENATNGEVVKAVFPDAEVIAVENEEMEIVEYVVKIDVETAFTAEWWNAPYGEKEPTVEQGLSYTDESGLQSAT